MKGLREKFRKNEGFTLVEMLIVVAIIAILIAVSLPLVGSSLEKAREAVDDANERSAISLGMIYYLTETTKNFSTKVELYYDIDAQHEGTLSESTTPPAPYGKASDNTSNVIKVSIQEPSAGSTEPVIQAEWVAGTTSP